MKLILFRHGPALDRDEAILQKLDDSQRPLTEKGRLRTEQMGRVLRAWQEDASFIVSSPLLRATQTAEILAKELKLPKADQCPELVPSAPPKAFAQWLKTHAKSATSLIAVGHEPQLSVFATWALAGQSQTFIELKKSGMICLEISSFEDIAEKTAVLSYLIQPKSFLALQTAKL